MKKEQKHPSLGFFLFLQVFLIFFWTIHPEPISANAAEPPFLTILVSGVDEGVDLIIDLDDSINIEYGTGRGGVITSMSERRGWETVYKFYGDLYSRENILEDATLVFKDGNTVLYEMDFPQPESTAYNQKWYMDFEDKTIVQEDPLGRQVVLVGTRILLTLLIEGLIFYLFGFREKRSWLAFIIINLITQGFLNISVAGATEGYLEFSLIFMEVLILIVEIVAFVLATKEKSKGRTILYTILANLASFLLGGYIILNLPI